MKIALRSVLLAIPLLAGSCLSAQNVVVQWNNIASTTIITNGKEASVASGAWFAYVHLAVFDAVNAIDHRFQPYLFTTQAAADASQDAAAVAAAHSVACWHPRYREQYCRRCGGRRGCRAGVNHRASR